MEDIGKALVGLLVMATLALVLYGPAIRWRARRATRIQVTRQLSEVEERYDLLRRHREDLLFHVEWARSRGDVRDAAQLQAQCNDLETELTALKARYDRLTREETSSEGFLHKKD